MRVILDFRDDHPGLRALRGIEGGCDQKGRQVISALQLGSSTNADVVIRVEKSSA